MHHDRYPDRRERQYRDPYPQTGDRERVIGDDHHVDRPRRQKPQLGSPSDRDPLTHMACRPCPAIVGSKGPKQNEM